MNNYDGPGYGAHRPIEIELIRSMMHGAITPKEKKLLDKLVPDHTVGPKDDFIIKRAGDWLLDKTPNTIARRLFGDFWFEGELCILFADTNAGKSILAVQIGDSISRGERVGNFALETDQRSVLYFDFELSSSQFINRYDHGHYGNYRFNNNFYRAVLNPGSTKAAKFGNYEDYINNALENTIINTRPSVLIIDNITCLRHGTQAATGALTLMRNLQQLKNRYGLSILVLAHTPKRDTSKPITRNDLQGSKMLINFCDSAFAIGESQTQTGTRYLKQIKQRNTAEAHGASQVCLCQLTKPANFLHFVFTGQANEGDHLQRHTAQERLRLENHVMDLYEQGKAMRQIAAEVNLSGTSIHRIVTRMKRQ
jgi:archaellum biogenesis ATPase FlaH